MAKLRIGRIWLVVAALVAVIALAAAIFLPRLKWASWVHPAEAIHLIGPVDYVGTEGLSAYLIHTTDGAMLIDATLNQNADKVLRNIAARGVRPDEVKLILLSHAHFDHAGGLAALKAATGAKLVTGARDREAVESGIPPGETSYGIIRFPAAPVDRGVADGETVALGDVVLTAISTPGHTPGCTSWSMQVEEAGQSVNVLFLCSLEVAGNKLVGNQRYLEIAADFRASFDRLAEMEADVVLPFHPSRADLFGRAERGELVDPGVLPAYVARADEDFERALAMQQE